MKKRTDLLLLIGGLLTTYIGSKVFSKRQVREVKPYFKHPSPYIFAHRGGMGLRPEHTKLAFDNASHLGVDGFEIDIRLTKDNEIVVLHDLYVDRVTENSGKVSDYTLEELRQLDFGYHFKDAEGNYSYRGHKDAKVLTLKELLEDYEGMLINIDIKDSLDTEAGQKIAPILFDLILEQKAKNRVLVTSFNDSQIDMFKQYSGNTVVLGAGVNEVRKAYSLYYTGFGHLYTPKRDTFQLPVKLNTIRLDNKGFINFLQDLNVMVGYWVVNETNDIHRILKLGAHTIVTDYPDKTFLMLDN